MAGPSETTWLEVVKRLDGCKIATFKGKRLWYCPGDPRHGLEVEPEELAYFSSVVINNPTLLRADIFTPLVGVDW